MALPSRNVIDNDVVVVVVVDGGGDGVSTERMMRNGKVDGACQAIDDDVDDKLLESAGMVAPSDNALIFAAIVPVSGTSLESMGVPAVAAAGVAAVSILEVDVGDGVIAATDASDEAGVAVVN
jgi:phospholipid N-methyltransferase